MHTDFLTGLVSPLSLGLHPCLCKPSQCPCKSLYFDVKDYMYRRPPPPLWAQSSSNPGLVNSVDPGGWTCLHHAVSPSFVIILFGVLSWTLFCWWICLHDNVSPSSADFFVIRRRDVAVQSHARDKPLTKAASCATIFLSSSVSLAYLMQVARRHIDMALKLCLSGWDVNRVSKFWLRTALHHAVELNDVEMVRDPAV